MEKRNAQQTEKEQEKEQPRLDEFELIHQLTHDFVNYHQHPVPNGDDAAIYLPESGQGQILCVDMMVEDIHFKRVTMSPFHIGYKALAANLSDIAAMGGKPHSFLVALAIPPSWSPTELKEMYQGMKKLADQYKVDLLGGDTTSTKDKLVLSITAIGQVNKNTTLLRSNAKAGDVVFVTGSLGDAAAGLDILLQANQRIEYGTAEKNKNNKIVDKVYKNKEQLIRAHQLPEPHVKQGQLLASLAQRGSIALNDISDGLASECSEIASSSKVNIVLNKERIPLSNELMAWAEDRQTDSLKYALHGGEDYKLVGTFPKELEEDIITTFHQDNLGITIIGHVEEGHGEVWITEKNQRSRIVEKGYNHFNETNKSKN
ncbi:thiamine-phosphate kinase [Bacillus horti]|uniref:Thiamine-monophosphate kinase n=1 Tax=Caldalkalibacillus horti TaxID=77523 RepID=A0ABT9W4U9_9BACI|nr:thiamine-phosphate kinase [Bacillus horti]MDQ0168283.1 thiamine-monophosphate kinase [Bacillus horti]